MDCNNNNSGTCAFTICPAIKQEAPPIDHRAPSVGNAPELVASPVCILTGCSLPQQQQQLILLHTLSDRTAMCQPQQQTAVSLISTRPRTVALQTKPELEALALSDELLGQPKKKSRRGKFLLWQFLLLDLINCHSDLSWHPDQPANPGVFAFKDPNSVARRWGRYKENENMSYEKMSRCIRDYYIRKGNRYYGVMQPDPAGSADDKKRRRRLHFAFNLQHHIVGQFIRRHCASYYHRLFSMKLLDSVPAGESP